MLALAAAIFLAAPAAAHPILDGLDGINPGSFLDALPAECKVHDHNPSNGGGVDSQTCEFKCNSNDVVLFFSRADDDEDHWYNPAAKAVAEVECGDNLDSCAKKVMCKGTFTVGIGGAGTCKIWADEWIESGFSGWCKSVVATGSQVCEDVSGVHSGLGSECFTVTGGAAGY